jgi:hypothetical protein
MRYAFGDTGVTGPTPPFDAAAIAASASAPAIGVTRRSSLRRTDGWHSTKVVSTQARVEVPPYVTGEFEVFVNGVPQVEGRDFHRDGNTLVFGRALAKEGRLGTMRWLSMLLGVAGTYRQNDSVDVVYESGGKRLVATDLPIQRD